MNVAVILAGGNGSRFGGAEPKQFVKLCGLSVLERSVAAFADNRLIDEVAVVTADEYFDRVRPILSKYPKAKRLLPSGAERFHSSLSAINSYADIDNGTLNLLIHDAARPLVSQRVITQCCEALATYEAVGVAVPSTDTLWQSDDEGNVVAIPDRRTMHNAQTPQCFRRTMLAKAYNRALQNGGVVPTDDAGVVLHFAPGVKIHIVEGERSNIKITYPGDIDFAEKYITEHAHKLS